VPFQPPTLNSRLPLSKMPNTPLSQYYAISFLINLISIDENIKTTVLTKHQRMNISAIRCPIINTKGGSAVTECLPLPDGSNTCYLSQLLNVFQNVGCRLIRPWTVGQLHSWKRLGSVLDWLQNKLIWKRSSRSDRSNRFLEWSLCRRPCAFVPRDQWRHWSRDPPSSLAVSWKPSIRPMCTDSER